MPHNALHTAIHNHIGEATGRPAPVAGTQAAHLAGGAAAESAFKTELERQYTPADGYEVIQLGSSDGELTMAEIDFQIKQNGELKIYLEFKQRFIPKTNTLETINTVKSYGGLFCPETKILAFEKSNAPVKIYVCELRDGFYYARYGGGWKNCIHNPIDPRTNKYSSSYDIPLWRFLKMNGKFVDTPLWNHPEAIFYAKIIPNGARYKKHIAGYNWDYDLDGKAPKDEQPILFYRNGVFEPYLEFVDLDERVNGRKYLKSPLNPTGRIEKYVWTETDKSNLLAIMPTLAAL